MGRRITCMLREDFPLIVGGGISKNIFSPWDSNTKPKHFYSNICLLGSQSHQHDAGTSRYHKQGLSFQVSMFQLQIHSLSAWCLTYEQIVKLLWTQKMFRFAEPVFFVLQFWTHHLSEHDFFHARLKNSSTRWWVTAKTSINFGWC